MRSTITARARIGAIVVAIALLSFSASALAPSASAGSPKPPLSYDISGVVTDPGPVTTDIVPAGSMYRFVLTGGSHWSGGLEGDTTYTGPGMFDPSTGVANGFLEETFTGSLPGVGSGRLDCTDHLVNNPDGSGSVDLWVVRGHGKLRGIHGYLHFSWSSTDADGAVTGEFHGVLYRA